MVVLCGIGRKKFKKSCGIIWLFEKVGVLLHSLSGTKPRGASSNRELHKRRRQEDKIQRSLLVVKTARGEKFKKSQLLKTGTI